jgi:hypothetical protein
MIDWGEGYFYAYVLAELFEFVWIELLPIVYY